MLAALSIDLDGLEHYHRIHGLPPEPRDDDPVHSKALERFGELCARLRIRGTAFCIGRDLDRPAAAGAVRRAARDGHEIANHSFSHDYALVRRGTADIEAEVRQGAAAIERVVGRSPVGFRAPGYTLSAPLLAAVAATGHRYDSSVLPAPPYHLAKAAVMAALSLAGRPSQAILDRPRLLLAPRRPYHPSASEPYAEGSLSILELPITTGRLGFPLVGTFVATLPWALVDGASRAVRREPLVNLELHGIDLLDASDASPLLAARQRDLRVPAADKIARIERFVRSFGERAWMTLAEASERLRAGPPPA
jgi:hypothetical protein